ncbi:MAG: hypothetical protein L0Y56_01460, partial [Nitrospira sp.]|nr:hypothetical protein [Nitrospira sp.]
PTNVLSESTTHRQASPSQNLPHAFLEDILKEEQSETEKDSKNEKKAVTQEEIDKLFDKNK